MDGLRLWDLAGADPALRFSPYCWRTRLALAQKGLEVETLSWRFADRLGTHPRVPVLDHAGGAIADSWTIAEWLEDTYPARPSLFRGEGGRALALFVNAFADAVQLGGIARLIVADVLAVLDPGDRDYFDQSRTKRFGMPLHQVVADRDQAVLGFRQSMQPMRMVLRRRQWLGGVVPSYADHILFGGFQWARCVSAFELLTPDDPIHAWRERMLYAYGGIARTTPAMGQAVRTGPQTACAEEWPAATVPPTPAGRPGSRASGSR